MKNVSSDSIRRLNTTSRTDVIPSIGQSALLSVTKRLPEAKNFCAPLPKLSRATGQKKNGRLCLTLLRRVQTRALRCSRSYLRYISTAESHNRGTYITRARRPALFPGVMQRTIFRERERYTRDARSECSFFLLLVSSRWKRQ